MSTYGKELLNKVTKDFALSYSKDRKIKSLTKKLANNSTSYEDANLYSIRVGELLSKALQGNINANTLSGNFISKEIAQEVLEPTLANNYNLISQAVLTVQTNQNKASQVGLQPQLADLNTDRIQGLVNKVASYDTLDQGNWVLGEPIVNYSQAIVDDSEAKNMEVYSKAGLEAKIVREFEGGACKWCKALAGTYDYAKVRATGSDVYRRHENCRCLVTYENGNKRQNVWSKAKWEVEEDKKRVNDITQMQKNISANNSIAGSNSKYAKELGEPYYKAVYDKVEKSNTNYKTLWDKNIEAVTVADKNYTSRAHASGESIYFNLQDAVNPKNNYNMPFQTQVHETSHALDYIVGHKKGNTYFSIEYKNGIFPKTIEQEVDDLITSRGKLIKELLENKETQTLRDLGAITDYEASYLDSGGKINYSINMARRALTKEVTTIDPIASGDFQDILQGATYNKVKVDIGHSNNYYQDRKTKDGINAGLATEAFAEFSDSLVTNDASSNILKQYLPNSYKVYEEMLKEMIK